MRGLKLMLFGIAVILCSGFFLVGSAVGYGPFSWGLFFGLLLSFLGLLMGESGAAEDGTRDERDDSGSNGDEGAAAENSEDDEGDASDERGDAARAGDHYWVNRFPPM